MKISVTKIFEFEAAHHLPNYDGACRNVHGHSYKLEVTVKGLLVKETGMVMDFSTLKEAVKEGIINKLDHINLNQEYDMPTAENMVFDIFSLLSQRMNSEAIKVDRVRLWETSTSYAEVCSC